MKIWASQGLRQNDALWILWVLEKLKETEYSTNKSVIQPVVGDGGLEGFRCLAVEGARVGPDPGGGGRPGVGLGRGGGRLEGVTGEGGPEQPNVQGGSHVCPPVRPSLLGVARACPCGQLYDDHPRGV